VLAPIKTGETAFEDELPETVSNCRATFLFPESVFVLVGISTGKKTDQQCKQRNER